MISPWEKCARKLSLNTAEDLIDLQELLLLVVKNCIENPKDPKYFNIKSSNKVFQTRLLSREGGVEFLLALGFMPIEVESAQQIDKSYFMSVPTSSSARSALLKAFRTGGIWLETTVNTCLKMLEAHGGPGCASVIVQLRLPNGTLVKGGFMEYDTVADVLSFACCYFTAETRGKVHLCLPSSSASVSTEEQLSLTLLDADWVPRVMLIASIFSEEEMDARISQSRMLSEARTYIQQEQAQAERKVVLSQASIRQAEKDKLMQSFKADREAKNERSGAAASAAAAVAAVGVVIPQLKAAQKPSLFPLRK